MKMYSIIFRKYGDYSKTYVSRKKDGKEEKLFVPEGSSVIVPEFDLMKYSSFGEGYDMVKYLGDLDDMYFYKGDKNSAMKALETSISKVID